MEIRDIQEAVKKALLNVGAKIYKIFLIYLATILIINVIINLLYRPVWRYMNTVYEYVNNGDYDFPPVADDIYLSLLFIFLLAFMSRLVTLGWSAACFRVSRGEKEISFHDLSSMFPQFWKVAVIYVVEAVMIQLGLFFFILPGLILTLRWSMAFFVLIEHPDYGPLRCLRQSSRLMVGEIKNLLKLGVSFLVQYLLAGVIWYFSNGLISLWKLPPLAIGYSAFYNRLVYWKPEAETDGK